jgi:hypothetical protein
MKTNWSDIQESKPYFWVMLKAWLGSVKAYPSIENTETPYNQYVMVKFLDSPNDEFELSSEFLTQMFDEVGIRLCVDFDKEDKGALWFFSVFVNKPLTDFWYQTYFFDGYLPNRKTATLTGLRECINILDSALEKEGKEVNFA